MPTNFAGKTYVRNANKHLPEYISQKKRHHLDGDALGTTRCKKFAIPSIRYAGHSNEDVTWQYDNPCASIINQESTAALLQWPLYCCPGGNPLQ